MDDCARLENVFTREGNGGSNPFLSAWKTASFVGMTKEAVFNEAAPFGADEEMKTLR